ncbi:MAG: PIN domain-containing protein, partial [Thermoleophilaceae bacterium]|nr:PIN domain-containing protein [Thermoleophilaceae bacterium]
LDTNVLVYAHRRDAELHAPARMAVEGLARGRAQWALPWAVVHEFLVAVTLRQRDPTPLEDALAAVERLLRTRRCVALAEPADHLARFAKLASAAGARGALLHDARIAAICIAHGVTELWTADRDFGRFPSLTTRNPLVE